MPDTDLVEFEWSYTPPELFETRSDIVCAGRTFVIDSGKVLVRVEVVGGQGTWWALANELHQVLHTQFLAGQVLSHERFTLSKPSFARIRLDGGRDVFVTLEEGARLTARTGTVDVVHTDAAGGTIHDSRKERIERRRSFAQQAAAHVGEPVVDSVLRSYGAAVNDPENELVHLYEVRDALANRFGGEGLARAAISISEAAWSRLGTLANGEPFFQGRHRGKHPGQLRYATERELEEARRIARAMIDGYFRYLASSD